MEKKMFYYQREQTDTAKLQDELTGALIALARAVDGANIFSAISRTVPDTIRSSG